MEENLHYLQTLLISISVSSVFFVGISVFILSGGINGNAFVTLDAAISKSALIGVLLGIIHGLAMGLFLIWRRSDSTINTLVASILAMEIISLSLCIGLWLWNRFYTTNDRDTDYFTFAYYFAMVFLYVSFFLLVPAILIGIMNRLLLFYFRK